MALRCLLIALAVVYVSAQLPWQTSVGPLPPPIPKPLTPNSRTSFFGNENFCSTRTNRPDGWKFDDKTRDYKANFTGQTRLCRRDFEEVCRTVNGVVPCNNFLSLCIDIPDTIAWNRQEFQPRYTARVNTKPQVCVAKGPYMPAAPDAAVVFIAQVMFSWVILTLGVIYLVRLVGKLRPTILMKVVFGLLYIPCVLLLFSYYYLNAILGFTALFAAYQLFARKRVETTVFAFAFLFLALFWVTFQNGLGDLQHQSRLRGVGPSNKASDYVYENYCEGYYRGFFTLVPELRGDFENPAVISTQYCDRNWLSAELFFMILLELLLAALGIVGGIAFWIPDAVEEAPAQAEEKATEMENRA